MGKAGLTNQKSDTVTVGVRFCGSCNPYYDPAEAKEKLELLLGFGLPMGSAEPPELCVIFKQCSSDCFPEPEKYSRYGTYIIQRAEDIPSAAKKLLHAIDELEE